MSNPEERQAGTPGSATSGARATGATATSRGAGYDQAAGYQQGTESYPPAGRHEMAGRGAHRGAVVTFTAVGATLMILAGLWDITVGIVSLSTRHVYVAAPASGYTYRWTLHGWGWGEIILGIVVFAVGVCVFLGMAWARYVGAALAVISAVANFMFIPFMPLWSIVLIALDAFIIWALLAQRAEPGQF
jgi:hypothetical protein